MTVVPDWAALGAYQQVVDAGLRRLAAERIIARIWAHDHTVWKPEPTEITNRLGWLHTADNMRTNLGRLQRLLEAVRSAGYTHALLLGMGGSSLAPELFAKTFGHVKLSGPSRYLALEVLDSTDPGAVWSYAERLDPARALFIVSTKSGGTVETLSFCKFFYNWVQERLGSQQVGEHFVAVTDPGTALADLAGRYHFHDTFLGDPNIGGRYSALSYFALVPGVLVGVDITRLLESALASAAECGPAVKTRDNPAAWLGVILGQLAKAGRDKPTLILAPPLASLGDWVEQLLAESLGKEGKGILPVVGEPLGPPSVYRDDRFFVSIQLEGTSPASAVEAGEHEAALTALQAAGHPVLRLPLRDRYDLGRQFFVWELATAVAGHLLGVNPFDQPDVEAAKRLARHMVGEYRGGGALPTETPLLVEEGIAVYGQVQAHSLAEVLTAFIGQAQPGAYIALQAYVQPTAGTDAALLALRTCLRDRFRLATTIGYGPRFLHSTGQLHKGDAGHGLFLQFTADDPRDAPIPDEAGLPASSISFGVLKAAQALGDRQALLNAGRRVLRFDLGRDVQGGLKRLADTLR